MKKRSTTLGITLGFLTMIAGASLSISAAENASRVTIKDGKPVILDNGDTRPLKENLQLTSAILVSTNGTFTVNNGQERKLEEGEILDKEGMLTRPNGTVSLVLDHITRVRGRVIIVRDGVSTPLAQETTLPTGIRLQPNGTMHLPNGRMRRLLDGQILNLDGSVRPSRDTAMLRDGKVFVQRDGAQFPLGRLQNIMMNDGTKVFGDGRVQKKNGEIIQLKEGQIVNIEGGIPY